MEEKRKYITSLIVGIVGLLYDIFYGISCTRHRYDTYVVSSATM